MSSSTSRAGPRRGDALGGEHQHAHGPASGAHVHDHGPGRHSSSRGEVSARLRWVLGLTATFMVAELVGGVLSNSLALLADAGHMFTDVAALGLSVFAIGLARRPPSQKRTYGYVRIEILAALVNGAALLMIAGLIIVREAWQRLQQPAAIDGAIMLSVAAAGLVGERGGRCASSTATRTTTSTSAAPTST
jgi:cobalt-zinc-cadmium efflux system protein